jgi:hypothetical protein
VFLKHHALLLDRMKKMVLCCCLLALAAQAAIQNVTVLGVTSTQAIIKFQAPSNAPCNVEVSESPTYSPLVYDVDPAKFSGSASDARPGSVSVGVERSFVVGKRAAEIGIDGVRYSRALQTATVHYFRISCPSTGDRTTGTFETTTIPFGSTYAEPEASDPLRPGQYAYPTLSSSDRTQQVIDPQTGVAIKRVSLPKDQSVSVGGVPLSIFRSNAWTGLPNLATADNRVATVSSSTGPLFLALNHATAPYVPQFMHPYSGAYQVPEGAFGYYQAHLIAAVNPGGASPANPEDAKIVACLTVDGASCYTGAAQYEARLTPALTDTVFGTTNTIDLWQSGPGTTLPRWTVQATRNGSVFCDGSPTVYLVGGDNFAAHWAAGSSIKLNGADYTIASVTHTSQLVLASNCPTSVVGPGQFDQNTRTLRAFADTFASTDAGRPIFIMGAGGGTGLWMTTVAQVIDARTIVTQDTPAVSGALTQFGFPFGYTAGNFGILVRKKTTSADIIAIDYGSVNYILDIYQNFTVGGGYDLCSLNTVTGVNGRPGYNCALTGAGAFYWIDAASGEAHLFGNLSTSPNLGCGAESQMFDVADPDTFYCGGTGPVYATKYYGNHAEPTALNGDGSFRLFQSFNNCNPSLGGPPYLSQQPCLASRLLTPGTDLKTLTVQFTSNPAYAPAYDPAAFPNIIFHSVDDNGNLFLHFQKGGQNTIAWGIIFNPSATSNSEGGSSIGPLNNHGCVGGGHPGCIIAAVPGWDRPGCRWCVMKGATAPYPGWLLTFTYGWTGSTPGSGPYYVQVIDGTANGTVNFIDGNRSLINCPANSFGATGRNCTQVTVASEPLSPAHGQGETGLPGELGPAKLGDRFATVVAFSTSPTEQMALIDKKPGSTAGTWIYTLARDFNHQGYATTGSNPPLYTICNANQVAGDGGGSSWYWNYVEDPHGMNATGKTIPPSYGESGGHGYWSHGNAGFFGTPPSEQRCAGGTNSACFSSRLILNGTFADLLARTPNTAVMALFPKFGQGSADNSQHQSHPTGGGPAAPPDRFNFMFDGRPYYGGFSSGSVTGSGSNPATLVAGQLYKFPKESMPNIDLPFRKIYPTTAFSGEMPLVDASSTATGDVLGSTSADSYKYCVAAAANECRQGSAVGDVYVNAPYVVYPFCYQAAQAYNLWDAYDICISGSPMIRDAIMQIDLTNVDNEGRYQRVLTKFNRARDLSVFYTPYVLPNGQWMIFESQFGGDGSVNKSLLLAKIPPPGPQDSISRLSFYPISLNLSAVPGANQAYVRFGYAENGSAANLFCTSRKESCVAGAESGSGNIDQVNPFFFEQTESSSWSALACTNGCTITVPAIPQRVLYYQYVYLNGSSTIYTSPVSATIIP